jgi:hypothetical protein
MKKEIIRMSESDLHKVIKESVEQILKENMEDEGFMDYFNSMRRQGGQKAQQLGNAAGQSARNFGNRMVDKAKQGYNSVANKAQQGYNALTNKAQQGYDALANKAQQGYDAAKGAVNNVAQGVKTMHQNAQADSAMADISKAVQILQNAIQKNPQTNKRLGSIVSQLRNIQGAYQNH